MMKNKVINLVIDLVAAIVIVGIIAFFLIGGPIGNPEEKTTEVIGTSTEATTETTTKTITKVEETTTEVVEETTAETTTEVEETTVKAVETTTKEVVTATAAPNLRAESASKYTDKEVYLFAQILYCEAGGVSRAEMARVGKVVLNRVNTDYHEFANCNTINQVLRQPGQYPETVAKIDNGIVPSQDALEVAEGLLNGTIQVPELSEDVLWQTGFVPDWNVRVVYQSGCHYYSVLAA